MTAAVESRADVELLLAELAIALRISTGEPADAIADPRGHDDAVIARALYEQTDAIQLRGRQIFLRTACRWFGDAFDAFADGREEEALRWSFRAAAELERYSENGGGE